jgi:hypothetical protein
MRPFFVSTRVYGGDSKCNESPDKTKSRKADTAHLHKRQMRIKAYLWRACMVVVDCIMSIVVAVRTVCKIRSKIGSDGQIIVHSQAMWIILRHWLEGSMQQLALLPHAQFHCRRKADRDEHNDAIA